MAQPAQQTPPTPPLPLPDNFRPSVNPLGVGLFAGCVFTLSLAVASTVGRLWSRKIKKQRILWSDGLILVALACSFGLMVVMGLLVREGQGRHVDDLLIREGPTGFAITAQNIAKIAPPISDLWIISVTCVRISILQLYITIFSGSRWFKISCWALAGVQVAGLITVLTLVNVFTPEDPQAYASYIVVQSLFLALDLSIAVLPVPLVWKLKMQTRTKVGVTALFGIGVCVCACSAIRLAWVKEIHNPDFTYQLTMPYFFSLMEPFLGITLANLPHIQPLMKSLSEALAESEAWQKIKSSMRITSRRTQSSQGSPSGTNRTITNNIVSRRGKPIVDEESVIELRSEFDTSSKSSLSKNYPTTNQIEITHSWRVQESRD